MSFKVWITMIFYQTHISDGPKDKGINRTGKYGLEASMLNAKCWNKYLAISCNNYTTEYFNLGTSKVI